MSNINRSIVTVMAGLMLLCFARPGLAQSGAQAGTQDDPVRLDGTTIRGDQELPLGLYITPWLDPDPEVGIDQPAQLLDEALIPLDPAAFRRQMLYWQALENARTSPSEQ